MQRRYELLCEVGVGGIDDFDAKGRAARARGEQVTVAGPITQAKRRVCDPMAYLLVIIDELADLMVVAPRRGEGSVKRLAQMVRAASIYFIFADSARRSTCLRVAKGKRP